LRTCCGYRYDQSQRQSSPPDFHGPSAHAWTQGGPELFEGRGASPVKLIPLSLPILKRKDNSSQHRNWRLQVRTRRRKPCDRLRNLNRTPFRRQCISHTSHRFPLRLRIGSPVSNCCSHGTLPHFSLQRSHLNNCYYHQDLH
jgi:hypothetical protein